MSEDEFRSSFITKEQFEEVKEDPFNLLRILEKSAQSKLAEQKATIEINVEQDLHNAQQHNRGLQVELDLLKEKLDDIQRKSNDSNPSGSSTLVIQQKSKINNLEVDLEALQAKFRSSLYAVETKTSQIRHLEEQLNSLEKEHLDVTNKNAELLVNLTTLQRTCKENSNELLEKLEQIKMLQDTVKQQETKLNQQGSIMSSISKEKREREFSDKERIEQLETTNQQITVLYENTKKRLNDVMEQNTIILNRCQCLEEQNTNLKQVNQQENNLNKELIDFQNKARKELLELRCENEALNEKSKNNELTLVSQIEELSSKVKKYEEELDGYHSTPSASDILAATTLGGSNSQVLLQLVSNYESKAQEVKDEKLKNARLTVLLENIQQQIQLKTPLIEKQKIEYQNAISEKEKLCNIVEQSLFESNQWKKRFSSIEHENQLLSCERDELARQVQLLLKENEQITLALPERSRNSLQVRSSQGTSFRNIRELQERNQDLIRQLKEQKLNFEVEFKKKYQQGLDELKFLRSNQKVMKQKIDTLMERDISSTKEESSEIISNRRSNSGDIMEISQVQNSNRNIIFNEEQNKLIREQQIEIKKLNQILSDKESKIASLQATIDSIREQRDQINNHCKELQNDISNLKNENTSLKTVSKQREHDISNLNILISKLKQQRKDLDQELQQSKPIIQSLNQQIKSLQERLSNEEKNRILIENCLEKFKLLSQNNEETRNRIEEKHSKEIQLKDEELKLIKSQNLSEFERYREIIRYRDNQLEEVNIKLQDYQRISQEYNANKLSLESSLEQSKIQINELRQQLKNSDARLSLLIKQGFGSSSSYNVQSNSSLNTDNIEISQLKSKIESLEDELAIAIDNQENYKSMLEIRENTYNDIEIKIKEQLEESKKCIHAWEQKYAESTDQIKQLLIEQEKLIKELENAKQLSNENNESTSALKEQIKLLQNQNELLKNEKQELHNLWNNCESKYAQEIRVHHEDMEKLEKCKNDLHLKIISEEKLNESIQNYENQLNQIKQEMIREVSNLNSQLNDMKIRNEDLQKQNNLLFSQLDTVSNDKKMVENDEDLSDNINYDKSNAELKEIINIMQKQKNQIQTELNISEHKLSQLRLREDRLLQDIERLQNISQSQVNNNSKLDNEDIISTSSMIQNIPALNESNALLRKQNNELETKIKQIQAQYNIIQSRLSEMENSKIQLDILRKENELLKQKNNDWELIVSRIQEHEKEKELERIDLESYNQLEQEYNDTKKKLEETNIKCKRLLTKCKSCVSELQSKKIELETKENTIKELEEKINELNTSKIVDSTPIHPDRDITMTPEHSDDEGDDIEGNEIDGEPNEEQEEEDGEGDEIDETNQIEREETKEDEDSVEEDGDIEIQEDEVTDSNIPQEDIVSTPTPIIPPQVEPPTFIPVVAPVDVQKSKKRPRPSSVQDNTPRPKKQKTIPPASIKRLKSVVAPKRKNQPKK